MITFCLLHNLFFFFPGVTLVFLFANFYMEWLPQHHALYHCISTSDIHTHQGFSQLHPPKDGPLPSDPLHFGLALLCAWCADAIPRSPLLSVPEVPATPVQYWTSFFRSLMSPFFLLMEHILRKYPVISLWKCKELSRCSGNSILVCLVRHRCSSTVLTIWWAFNV